MKFLSVKHIEAKRYPNALPDTSTGCRFRIVLWTSTLISTMRSRRNGRSGKGHTHILMMSRKVRDAIKSK